MEKTLLSQKDPLGVGLSAPQVGVLQHIFIIKPDPKSPIEHFINPEILQTDNSTKKQDLDEDEMLEGCLSIPKTWAPVERDDKVKIGYQTLDGKKEERWFSDLESVAVQHEIDHLHGILFTQRALEQGKQIYKEVRGKLVPMKL
jgi:peptide deformylase